MLKLRLRDYRLDGNLLDFRLLEADATAGGKGLTFASLSMGNESLHFRSPAKKLVALNAAENLAFVIVAIVTHQAAGQLERLSR